MMEKNTKNFKINIISFSIFSLDVFLLIPKNKNIHIKLWNEVIMFIRKFDEKFINDVKTLKNKKRIASFFPLIFNLSESLNIILTDNINPQNINIPLTHPNKVSVNDTDSNSKEIM